MRRLGTVVDAARGRVHPRDAVREVLGRPEHTSATRRPRTDPAAPEVLLSPHLDDAVLSCWSLLREPRQLTVVNVFTAAPADGVLAPYDRIAGADSSAGMMRARALEDRDALARAGRVPVSLDLLEASYRSRAPAIDALLSALGERVRGLSGVVAPAAIGLHPDHVLVRAAAMRLARAGVPLRLYADLPYCVTYGWPAWVSGEPPQRHLDVDAHWNSALDPLRRAGHELIPEVRPLGREQQQAKLEALRTYATQYPTLTRGRLDVLADPHVLGREVTWKVGVRGSTRTR